MNPIGRVLLSGALALPLSLTACDGEDKRRAASLVAAVEQFRRAENAARPARVEAIRAVACAPDDVCRARDACLASAEPTAKALTLKAEAENAIGRLERGELAKDAPEARALPQKLDDAQRLLDEGHDALAACDDALIALKRRYALR